MIVVLTAIALASHMHAAAGGGSFVDRFETIDWGRWDYRGSFMLGGHGSDAYIALPDDEHLSHGAGGLTMTMNDQPCASNASACCCSGEQTIPCVQNFSAAAAGAGAHPARRCAQFATGHLLSKVSYGYGTYEAAIQFSGAKGAVSFFDIGEHELCESPHEETQFYYTGGHDWNEGHNGGKYIKTGYYTPTAGVKDGSVGHAALKNLTFDPSQDVHVYRIEWERDFIAWSIDGVEIRRATSGIPPPDPGGKPECAKIKFILHPGSGGFSGEARNHIRYIAFNASADTSSR